MNDPFYERKKNSSDVCELRDKARNCAMMRKLLNEKKNTVKEEEIQCDFLPTLQ